MGEEAISTESGRDTRSSSSFARSVYSSSFKASARRARASEKSRPASTAFSSALTAFEYVPSRNAFAPSSYQRTATSGCALNPPPRRQDVTPHITSSESDRLRAKTTSNQRGRRSLFDRATRKLVLSRPPFGVGTGRTGTDALSIGSVVPT